jgi:hypothetical protein
MAQVNAAAAAAATAPVSEKEDSAVTAAMVVSPSEVGDGPALSNETKAAVAAAGAKGPPTAPARRRDPNAFRPSAADLAQLAAQFIANQNDILNMP